MNFVITAEMVDVTVLVGVISGIFAAGFIAYGEIQRGRARKSRTKGSDSGGRRKLSKMSRKKVGRI